MMHRRQILFIVILVCSFLFCFWSTLKGLVNVWISDGDYSYAPLIPFISAYIMWERRQGITTTQISTNWLGGLLLLLFMAISTYGILGSSPSAVRPAIPFVILSLTFFCFGNSLFKVLAFPLSLLFFMVPLPTAVQNWIGLPLRTVSTKVGELMLRIWGVPAYIEGNIIDLGVTQLQVVDACSGLRYILPLLALGVIFAYFFEKKRWKQFVLVASTIPISIAINGFRIGTTGILTQWMGRSAAEGFFHDFSGWLIFIVAFALLFILHRLMKAVFKNTAPVSPNNTHALKTPIASSPSNNTLPVIVSSLLLILAGIISLSTAALPNIVLQGSFTEFPMVIGEWKGQAVTLDTDIIEKSGAEEALNALFTNEKKETISLYIGYRGSPFLENENFFHSPTVCLVSSGWKSLSTRTHIISGLPVFGEVEVSAMVTEKMGYRQLVYFWFQTKTRVSHNVNINRYHLSLHAIVRDNTYDLFIRPITEFGPSERIEDAEARLDNFIREMMPVLLQFLKENQVTQ